MSTLMALSAHAAPLDVRPHEEQQRPSRLPLRVAVVGAGVAGAACARAVLDAGYDVVVFDKGRGPGGRCSTRTAAGDRRFDHGAQFFTASDERFARFVEQCHQEGLVAPWTPRIIHASSSSSSSSSSRTREQKWVAAPGMSALLKHMLADVAVQFGVRVASIAADGDRFCCTSDDGRDLGVYDAVVVAVPAPQASPLLANIAPMLSAHAAQAQMQPTWALMLDYDGAGPDVDADVIEVRGRALRWAAREASKPGRAPGVRWLLHGRVDDDDPARATATLLAEFVDVVGASAAQPAFSAAHLWRYAFVARAVGSDCLVDGTGRVVACGDWCVGPRVEAAYLSGVAAAGRLLALR
jgi:renalase